MADREIIRPPFKADFPNISDAGFRYLQQLAAEVNLIRGGTTHGTPTDYTQIEKDGTIIANGNATCWKDENFGGATTAIGASAPALVSWNTTSILIPQFQHNLTKELNMLKEYDHAGIAAGSLQVHAHLHPTTADTGTVKLFCEYQIKVSGQTALTGTLNGTATMGGVAWEEIRLNIGTPITHAMIQRGAQIGMRLYRLSTDAGTYAHPVAISTWGYHYEVDMLGSRLITTK